VNDLNRSSTESLFHIEMSKTYVANGKEFGLVYRNRISFYIITKKVVVSEVVCAQKNTSSIQSCYAGIGVQIM